MQNDMKENQIATSWYHLLALIHTSQVVQPALSTVASQAEAVDSNPLYQHIPLTLFLLTYCLSFQLRSYI